MSRDALKSELRKILETPGLDIAEPTKESLAARLADMSTEWAEANPRERDDLLARRSKDISAWYRQVKGAGKARHGVPIDAHRFYKGLIWKDFVAQMGDTRARTESNYEKSRLTEEEREYFAGITQVRYAVMTVENWSGDVHRNAPLIAHICDAIPECELRVFFRDQNPELRDALLNNGYQSIPAVVFFDSDWNEIGRWIERPHAATTTMAIIRSTTIDAAGSAEAARDAAMNDFRKQVQAAYESPGSALWRGAANEIKLLLEAGWVSRGRVAGNNAGETETATWRPELPRTVFTWPGSVGIATGLPGGWTVHSGRRRLAYA